MSSGADAAPDAPVGVFDSGVGGLTVLDAVRGRLPGESTVYLGDTARLPYGPKSPETVRRYARECADFLLARGVKMLVVACNTASARALPGLDEEVPVPVVGVVLPGAREAAERSRSGRIGVIGTRGTIESGAYQDAIRERRPDALVRAAACPLFVPLVEEGWTDDEVARLTAEAVAAKWDKITDKSVQTHFNMGGEHGQNIFARLAEGNLQAEQFPVAPFAYANG